MASLFIVELQQNRSWIKGLGKNPQKSELIHWRQCLFVRGHRSVFPRTPTPACIHVIQRLSQPRVACWHGFRQNSQKTECVFTRCPTGGRKKIACIYGLRSEGVLKHSIIFCYCTTTPFNTLWKDLKGRKIGLWYTLMIKVCLFRELFHPFKTFHRSLLSDSFLTFQNPSVKQTWKVLKGLTILWQNALYIRGLT